MIAQAADIPRSLPWYFVVIIVAFWLAVVWGVLLIGRHRLHQRAERRRRAKRRAEAGPGDVIDVVWWEDD